MARKSRKKQELIEIKERIPELLAERKIKVGGYVRLSSDHKLILDFHVIVAYGVSIMTVSENLIESVKYKVEEFTGLDVEKINVFVEGVRVID